MKENFRSFICSNPLKLSEAQRRYIISGTYEILSSFGTIFYRKLNLLGVDPRSGNALIQETYSGEHPYQKIFVLSPDGKPEKYRGQEFVAV